MKSDPIRTAADYSEFIDRKSQLGSMGGFEPTFLPEFLFDFQKSLVEWAVMNGRAAIFADCGMGKTAMELVWAENVVRKENRPVLILTPLAVSSQTVGEGEKFGIEVKRSYVGSIPSKIVVTNYERLHYFKPRDFAGVVCDESGILKNWEGARKAAVTEFLRTVKYRLLSTATASPNDYVELGTHSEALGELGYMDMLGRFFKNDQGSLHAVRNWDGTKWRFKRHAEEPFWRWVCSWSRSIRRPSDLGFDDDKFILPALHENEHVIQAKTRPDGFLFDVLAANLQEQRQERRRTIGERCEKAADLSRSKDASIAWCHLNVEGDLLEKLIPQSVQISGDDPDEAKEEKLLGFLSGQFRVLVSKSIITGFGLNLQHCAHMTIFPSHSWEQYYQSVRRCWRFGQNRPVTVDIVASEGERGVLNNLNRKAAQADRMFSELVAHMNGARKVVRDDGYAKKVQVPTWG